MPRPLRIEYEDAYYHVMNRGRSHQQIFHDASYYETFLTTLSEAHRRFGIQILSYCLMDNHYHLLVKTPEANLGRAMRHINGVYTQRHNRLKKTDGSLFRGRYKAICIEEDSYQLQCSRYIHRNPLESKMVSELIDYRWSSYGYFVTNKKPPEWLYMQDVINQLGVKSLFRAKYREFVQQGIDEELTHFYGKGNLMPFLGSDTFREWAYSRRDTDESEVTKQDLQCFRPKIDEIINHVAGVFNVSESSIRLSQRGRVDNNVARWVALYISREYTGVTLKEIARHFGLKRTGSIPTTINKLQVMMEEDKGLLSKVMEINSQYDI